MTGNDARKIKPDSQTDKEDWSIRDNLTLSLYRDRLRLCSEKQAPSSSLHWNFALRTMNRLGHTSPCLLPLPPTLIFHSWRRQTMTVVLSLSIRNLHLWPHAVGQLLVYTTPSYPPGCPWGNIVMYVFGFRSDLATPRPTCSPPSSVWGRVFYRSLLPCFPDCELGSVSCRKYSSSELDGECPTVFGCSSHLQSNPFQ